MLLVLQEQPSRQPPQLNHRRNDVDIFQEGPVVVVASLMLTC
jgi:hypothetical protein